jgi:excisionase family DNA binding protein
MNSTPTPAHAPRKAAEAATTPLLMTIPATALQLALSIPTIKRMLAARGLPGVTRIGRRVLVNRAVLLEWVNKGCPPLGQDSRRKPR